MPYNNISQSLTTTNKNDIQAHVDGVKFILSFLVNLTPQDRKKILKMGKKSVAFVSEVLVTMQTNPAAVPAAFAVNEFEKDYQLYVDLQFVLSLLRPVVEGIEDTLLLLGSDLMRQGLSGYKILREGAKTNMTLDTVVSKMGARFKRSSKTKPTVFTLQPQQTLTLNGVLSRRLIKSLNESALTLYRGENAFGKNKIVGGNSQIYIPAGWNQVTIFNNHQSAVAIFSLTQK